LSFRVLLAEDEALLSLLIKETLTDLGCSVVGPVTSVAASIAVLDIEHIDLALIDLALSGEWACPSRMRWLIRASRLLL
jgi:CheY-like chemotaxis protein